MSVDETPKFVREFRLQRRQFVGEFSGQRLHASALHFRQRFDDVGVGLARESTLRFRFGQLIYEARHADAALRQSRFEARQLGFTFSA